MQSATTIVVVETPLHSRPAAADSLLPRERATAARSMREMVGGAGSVRRASHYQHSRDAPRTRCRCRCLRGPSLPASSHVTRPANIGSAIHRPPRVPSSTCRVRERKRMRSGERERERRTTEEPSSSSPRPLAPDPPAVIAQVTTAPFGLGWGGGGGEKRGSWRRGRGQDKGGEGRMEHKKIFLREKKRGKGMDLVQGGPIKRVACENLFFFHVDLFKCRRSFNPPAIKFECVHKKIFL